MASAELAVVLLAVIAAVVPAISGVQLLVGHMRAEQAAFGAARMLARGDDYAAVQASATRVHPEAQIGVDRTGAEVAVSVQLPVRLAVGATMKVRAQAVAAVDRQ